MNIALIGLVVLQIRGHKITRARLLVPVVLTVWAGQDMRCMVGAAAAGRAGTPDGIARPWPSSSAWAQHSSRH